jgi:hypothetical protein
MKPPMKPDLEDPSPLPNTPSDPLIDTALRIGELRAEVEKVAGQPLAEGVAPGTPLDLQESFWDNVLAFENAPRMPLGRALLERRDFRPQPLENLDTDEKLHAALWELIEAFASMRIVLHCTDHLSDRELYRHLVEQILPEETEIVPDGSEWNHHYDLSELPLPGSDEAYGCYFAYYADEEERAEFATRFPDQSLPPSRPLPFDRDWFLPNPGY